MIYFLAGAGGHFLSAGNFPRFNNFSQLTILISNNNHTFFPCQDSFLDENPGTLSFHARAPFLNGKAGRHS